MGSIRAEAGKLMKRNGESLRDRLEGDVNQQNDMNI